MAFFSLYDRIVYKLELLFTHCSYSLLIIIKKKNKKKTNPNRVVLCDPENIYFTIMTMIVLAQLWATK